MRSLDAYNFSARVIPFVAVFVPPIVLLVTGVVTGTRFGVASGLLIAVVGAIASQLGRDRGRNLQPDLWAGWGGSPTIQRLRYRGQANPGRTERLHQRIQEVLGETLPTADEESADPEAADDRYDEISARIRALTRDHDRFRLLFAENINYGQRRNLLGWKPAGIGVAVLTLVVSGLAIWLTHGDLPHRLVRFGPGLAAALAMLALWALVVRRDWVRVPAEAYADQFVGAVDQLHFERTSDRQSPA